MPSLALLILRLAFGLGFAVHGYQSLFVAENGITGLAGLIESKGWPAPEAWAYLAKITELVGGLMVALGFLTRASALACAGTMAVAIWMAHLGDPFRDPATGKGWELTGLYLAAFLALLFSGGGKLSVDGLRKDRTPEPAPAAMPPFAAAEVAKPAAAAPPVPEDPVQGSDGVWDGKE